MNPFSVTHPWSIHWHRLPSNFKRMKHFNGSSEKEQKAMLALASVGLIGGQQLQRMYGIDKKRLRNMVREQKIIRHEMHLKGKIVPIYTLGINGACMAGMEETYELNYWVAYRTEDVLKRIVFFQLWKYFDDLAGGVASVGATPKPFIGSIQIGNNLFYVYVIRGDANELLTYLKWNKDIFNKRLIIAAESLRHMEPLKEALAKLKVRVVLDDDLTANQEGDIPANFYFIKDGTLTKEVM